MDNLGQILLFLAGLGLAASALVRLASLGMYARLERLVRAGRFEEARHPLQQLLKMQPQLLEKSPLLAQASLDVRLLAIPQPLERTREFFLEVARTGRQMRPASPVFPRLWANLLRQEGKVEEGLRVLEEAARQAPGDPQQMQQQAWFCELSGRLEEAAEHYRRALDAARRGSPRLRARLLRGLGQVLSRLGSAEPAAEAMRSSLELDPCSPEALFIRLALAGLYERLGRPDEGAAVLQKGLEQCPFGQDILHQALGSLLGRAGHYKQAMAHLDRAQSLNPDQVGTRLVRAQLEMARGNPERAFAELQEAHDREPRNPLVLLALARYHESLGDDARAMVYYEQALAGPPPDQRLAFLQDLSWEAHEKLADCYVRLGRLDDAEAEYRRALKTGHRAPMARASLALLLARRGRQAEADRLLEEAEAEFREAIARVPGDPRGYVGLGGLLLQRGQLEQARQLLEKALELAPDDFLAHTGLGEIFSRLGQNDRARSHWEKARALAARPDLVADLDKKLSGLAGSGL
jgi:Flp pilus assembly protein TadD